MRMLRQLCTEYTSLWDADIRRLEDLERTLQLIADLTGSDVFIDCMLRDGSAAVVVAEAKPLSEGSAYNYAVAGKMAPPDKEPAVFHAFTSGMPVRDLKAVTQENQLVKQDVVPIRGERGQIIAVLIQEKDVSRTLMQEKKYETLVREREDRDASLFDPPLKPDAGEYQAAMREVHHRVKNNLQLVASILNMQARKCEDLTVRRIFQENVNRVLSIAAIHDILTLSSAGGATVHSKVLLEKLRRNLQTFVPEGKSIAITAKGDDLVLDPDQATSVSLVVSELVSNALEHAFEGRGKGNIIIMTQAGNLYHTVIVEDDGVGFDPAARSQNSLGLDIVTATVQDKLRGELRMSTGPEGTKALFDFKAENRQRSAAQQGAVQG